ncbi:MAG: heme biosynthesis protein HemY [Burkholderiales bacterium]|nr:heme biosynthesis protein HemY [Burkholderiales bacterium]MDE1927700.1 heme biosynthesis protein HemY [Burkholderiales bacterium]MDE2159648.1 heme biosynthesis protein HemY [Burkholderiales bacterium]MDE2502097.1 heme biosynthesis protein HemY [Burkholderiales bacterium]
MRGVIWLVLIFVVAVVAATTLGSNDGLVSLYWGGWRTDLSLNLFVIALVGACVLLMSAVQAINALISLPQRAGAWRALRRERAAQAALREALGEFFGARYGRARKAAQRALQIADGAPALSGDGEFRMIAHLLAAGSLHRLQDRARRDEALQQALQAARGGSDDAARLLAAEWALEDRDAARALRSLEALPPGAGRRTQALRLKLQALRMDRRPLEALHTARLLANHQAFSPIVAQSLLRSLVGETLEGAHDIQQLRRLWSQFDQADRRDAQVAARAAQRACQLDANEDARVWLRPFWDRLSDIAREDREAVAMALIDARGGIGVDWLPRLESAVQAFSHENAVVAAVGMVFAERQLWGKARRLLEQAAAAPALPARTRRAAWRELARLARQESDEAQALRCEQAAAALD